jgi:hypothetical protein
MVQNLDDNEFQKEFYELVRNVKELTEFLKLKDVTLLNEEVLNSKQVMKLLQITEPTLIKLESQRKIRFKRIGKGKRYLRSDIMKYLHSAS